MADCICALVSSRSGRTHTPSVGWRGLARTAFAFWLPKYAETVVSLLFKIYAKEKSPSHGLSLSLFPALGSKFLMRSAVEKEYGMGALGFRIAATTTDWWVAVARIRCDEYQWATTTECALLQVLKKSWLEINAAIKIHTSLAFLRYQIFIITVFFFFILSLVKELESTS